MRLTKPLKLKAEATKIPKAKNIELKIKKLLLVNMV
jgi:hypothetical protein